MPMTVPAEKATRRPEFRLFFGRRRGAAVRPGRDGHADVAGEAREEAAGDEGEGHEVGDEVQAEGEDAQETNRMTKTRPTTEYCCFR